MAFAIIKTGGKQYRVEPGQTLKIEKIDTAEDGAVIFDEVLLVSDENGVKVGTPHVAGAKVEAKLVKDGRARKIIVFRYHSKTRYKKKKGHRQTFTEVEILKIS